jgi:hypothetical protein
MRLDGLDTLAADAGPAIGAWLCRAVARNVRACARDSDLVQDDDHGSYRVLLVETDEDRARWYVDRVSRPLLPSLADPHAEVRLTVGWAGTSSEPDLQATDRLAQARLDGASAGWIRSSAAWRS